MTALHKPLGINKGQSPLFVPLVTFVTYESNCPRGMSANGEKGCALKIKSNIVTPSFPPHPSLRDTFPSRGRLSVASAQTEREVIRKPRQNIYPLRHSVTPPLTTRGAFTTSSVSYADSFPSRGSLGKRREPSPRGMSANEKISSA